MNLVIVTPIYPPEIGGPASYVSGLVARLKEHHRVKIVTFAESNINSGGKVYRVPVGGGMLLRQLRLLLQLGKLAQKNQVIYAQGTIVVGVASFIASKLKKIPLVVKFVGDEVWEPLAESGKTKETLEAFYAHKYPYNIKLWLHRLVLKKADSIIVPSKYLKDFLTTTHRVNPARITVISNAVEIPKSFIVSRTKDPYKLIFVGRLVPWKHVDQIIEAVYIARKKIPWTLTIVGEGTERNMLERQMRRLKAESWIIFRGKLSKLETLKEIATSARLVLYSSYEGQPHTLIEAMLLKIPIIASDIKPHTELLKNTPLVPVNNPKVLAEAINNSGGSKTRAINQNVFSWEKHLQKLEVALGTLL